MAPPSATDPSLPTSGNETGKRTLAGMPTFPGPPKFTDKYAEREYQKGRLALAFRIFGKLGFDEGVAGHITLRVRKCFHRLLLLLFLALNWVERGLSEGKGVVLY